LDSLFVSEFFGPVPKGAGSKKFRNKKGIQMLQSFRTYQLAKSFYNACQGLHLKAPMRDQFERAVLSVVLNLAEGSGKPTINDRRKFYSIALGSLRETQAILDLLSEAELYKQSDQLGASLYRLIQSPVAGPDTRLPVCLIP